MPLLAAVVQSDQKDPPEPGNQLRQRRQDDQLEDSSSYHRGNAQRKEDLARDPRHQLCSSLCTN